MTSRWKLFFNRYYIGSILDARKRNQGIMAETYAAILTQVLCMPFVISENYLLFSPDGPAGGPCPLPSMRDVLWLPEIGSLYITWPERKCKQRAKRRGSLRCRCRGILMADQTWQIIPRKHRPLCVGHHVGTGLVQAFWWCHQEKLNLVGKIGSFRSQARGAYKGAGISHHVLPETGCGTLVASFHREFPVHLVEEKLHDRHQSGWCWEVEMRLVKIKY